MNERIRELAIEAGLQQRTWNSLGKELPMWQEDPDNPGLAKFAVLIIKECAALSLNPMQIDEAQYYHGWLDYRDEILKHFGVK